MLTPDPQEDLVRRAPATFVPSKGAWGERGCTQVLQRTAKATALSGAIRSAWRNKAPTKLIAQLEAQ